MTYRRKFVIPDKPKVRSNALIPRFRGMSKEDAVKILAIEISDNRRCWWIYQHIINSSVDKRRYKKPR